MDHLLSARINKQHLLFVLQIVALTIYSIVVTDIIWSVVFICYFLYAGIGASITFHRYLSHKSFEFKNKIIERFFILMGFLGLVGSPLAWANNHIAHHKFGDTANDPHSPHQFGYLKIQFMSMYHTHNKIFRSIAVRCGRDPFVKFLHDNYFSIHIALFILLLSFASLHIAASIYFIPVVLTWHIGSLINTLNHSNFGYQNHKCDSSKNNLITGYLLFGEGWHNNHHMFPKNANFKEKWWEFDLLFGIISLVKK